MASNIEEVRAWWEDAKQFYAVPHARIGEQVSFTIDQQHYQDDNDRDPQRIKPTDPALLNLQRHKAARILKNATYYELRPVDKEHDPQAAAQAKALLDQATNDPESEFPDALEDVVDGGLAAQIWGLEVGWDPDCGPNGELTFESVDPRRVFWTPGFKSPHSRRCPWLIIEKKMLPAEIARMSERGWKNTSDVPADAYASMDAGGSAGPIRDTTVGETASSEMKYTTVLFCYDRFVKTTKQQEAYRSLKPEDRYMGCLDCGFKGMPQKYLDVTLPPVGMEGDMCPDCGQPTQTIGVEPVSEEVLAYRKGKRLRIIAPVANREFWNDRWEFDTRGFTVLMYSPYNHPLNPIPHSDTYYYRSLTCVSDAMLRLGYEQMRKAHGIILAPQDSLYDAYGEAFPFSEHRDVAYYDTDILNPNAIQWFQPPGLNAAWTAYYQTIQGVFAANKGTGDLGLTQQQSKDIAVGTVRTLVETGEIPVDRHIQRFQRFLSLVLTRALEIMRTMMTSAGAVRVLGPDGASAVQQVRASALPGYDVIVTAEPKLAQQDLETAKAFEIVASKPAPLRSVWARALGVPPQWVEQLNSAEAAMKAQAQPPVSPGTMNPGNGVPMPQLAGALS